MAGKKFLNPYAKLAICLFGMALMGYYLYPVIAAGNEWEQITYVRAAVFVAFVVIGIRTVRGLVSTSQANQNRDEAQ